MDMNPVMRALQTIAAIESETRKLSASSLASSSGPTAPSANSKATADLNRGSGAPPIAQVKASTPEAAFTWDREIRIDARDRVAVAPTRSVPARAVTTLAATVLLALALCLGWVGGLNSDFFALRADLPSVERVTSSTAAIAAKPVQELPSNVRASTGNYETSQRSAPTADSSLRKQVARVPSPPAVDRTNLSTRSAPVPETKPTTIKGWTVREVEGGTAVLEGPNGIWRATLGDTVPGVGKIDSIVRWGNRWIIATSKGLISTR